MSDHAGLVQRDELQYEYESAESHQSSRDAAAAAAGLATKPPTRLIRSYDRQEVGQCQDMPVPPSYDESESTAGVQSKQQQQQSAGYGNDPRQNASYNQGFHQQFQHSAPQQRATTVIRVPANQIVVAPQGSRWSPYQIRATIIGTIIGIKLIVIMIIVIVITMK